MNNARAFIFDLNGTMIDDMKFHTEAWFKLLNDELGMKLGWDEVKEHMYGKNSEVLDRIFGRDHFNTQEVERISAEKENRYREAFLPHLNLIAGLDEFLQKASNAGIRIAIGSAAIPENIDFVLDNLNIRKFFNVIVSAEDVHTSKPDPETFLKAASQLNIDPSSCIVFEDAPKGVDAAARANMNCVVLTTAHDKETFKEFSNVLAIIKDYNDPFCNKLLKREPVFS